MASKATRVSLTPTILVLDDDKSMRALLRLHLTNAGYRVVLAEDAIVAGRLILESPPDLLIADINLPYMDGLEFVATLIADSTVPTMPVIFVTAQEQSVERAKAIGAACLVKPFFADKLLEIVARTLGDSWKGLIAETDRMPSKHSADQDRLRALIVDDNLDIVHSTAVLLNHMGHHVESAINGVVALDRAQRFRPQVVLLDLGLPDADGCEVARQIRRNPELKTVRIVAVSGRGREDDQTRSLQSGCDEYVRKPLDPASLERLVTGA